MSAGDYAGPRKMGRWRWVLKSSRVLPFYTYGEAKEMDLGDTFVKVSFTSHGWLEQMWVRQTEFWWEEPKAGAKKRVIS